LVQVLLQLGQELQELQQLHVGLVVFELVRQRLARELQSALPALQMQRLQSMVELEPQSSA
jgi:hypothetical protein